MDLTPAARPAQTSRRLAPGTRLGGGRYTLGNPLRQGLFAYLYEATDTTTGNAVTIHLLDGALAQSRDLVDRLANAAREAAALGHKNVAQVIELAVEGPNTYVATELVEGNSLRELLERKRETGTTGFGAKGAVNIITHVAAALSAAGEAGLIHGALSLDAVAVSRAGRVRVSDFGLIAAVPALAKLGKQQPSFAPEVISSGRGSAASDVYGLGALLYEVLVGTPPVKGCKRPSEALPDVPAAVDAVIGRSMSPAPDKRYPSVEALREAMTAAMSEPARPSGSQPTLQRSSGSGPQPAASASLAESIHARMSGQVAVPESPDGGAPAQPMPVVSLAMPSPTLQAAMQNRDEKWLISKGKLDYGPFNLAHIAEQVQTDQILPGHVIIDKDTGSRKKIEDHPLLFELVEAAKQKRDERRRAQAEVHHVAKEKRRGATLYVFIFLVVCGLGGGVYLLVTKLSADKKDVDGAIEGLQAGSLQAKISFPTKEERRARARGRGGKRGGGSTGGVAGGYDDTLDLDMSPDEEEDEGSGRLSDSDVNPVIQRHGGGLARCLSSTGSSGANIEFIVQPTGKVSGVRVNGKTDGGLSNCIRGVMTKMQFPTFNGVRSKHYFDIGY